MNNIIYDEKVLVRKPIINGTRISVDHILKLLPEELTFNDILHEFPGLTKQDILACLDYAAKTLMNQEIIFN